MVTRSNVNWHQHLEDVYDVFYSRYGEKRADKFIKFYFDRYDRFGRTYIDYKLAFWLMDDYAYVRKIGTRFYAVVGTGGTGKTTLMMNISYFFDDALTLDCVKVNMRGFITKIKSFPKIGAMRSIFMDEPDDTYHSRSKQGKQVRSIVGKMRQQKLFVGMCATDLRDIPTWYFSKLDGIFFTPYLGKYFFFKNRPRRKEYVLQEIRAHYMKKGYKVFFEMRKRVGCLEGTTIKGVPFSKEQIQQYLGAKKEDYSQDIDKFLDMTKPKAEKKASVNVMDKVILKLRHEGMSHREIGEKVGLARQRIGQILGKYPGLPTL